MKINHSFRSRYLIVYFLLTFIISWGSVVIIAGPDNIPINSEVSKDLLPLLYVSMLLGPSIAGILMIFITEGKSGIRKLILKLLNWRVNPGWYVLAIFATPALAILTLFVLSLFSPEYKIVLFQSDNIGTLVLNGIIAGIMVGIFEEIGWTGFVTPKLIQQKSILITGLFIGLEWGAWHFILFWEQDSYSGILPILILVGRLFFWLPPFRVFMVWMYNRTESLLLTILTHMSLVFTTTVIVPMTLTGKSLLIWLLAWSAIIWIVAFVVHHRKLQ